jgi:hypothetical protein
MPVPPAELTATFSIEGPAEARAAAADAAGGLAREAGPEELLVAGARAEVLAALGDAVVAALDAGAHELEVRLQAPTEARP